jgi:hypothetical protein
MKMKQILAYLYTLILVILLSSLAFSQNTPSEDDQYLAFATSKPELVGSMGELTKKIKYPVITKSVKVKNNKICSILIK